MNRGQINLVRRSFRKLSVEAFAESFYSHLFSIQPALRLLFPDDFDKQKEKLTGMLESAIEKLDEPEKLVPFLEESGRRHALYGVRAEHYETARAAFLESLRETSAGEFTAETEAAWTKLYEEMSETMKRGARRLADAPEGNNGADRVLADGLLQANTLGAAGSSMLCCNASNQISTRSSSGKTAG